MTEFPERLRALRKDKKLTQTELGEAMGVQQATIAKWESGERTPFIEFRLKSMLKFAKLIALPSKIGTHINEKCSFYFVLSFDDHFFSTIQYQR